MLTYISADQIHDGEKWLPLGTILKVDEQGAIKAIQEKGSVSPQDVHYYDGILCPGFVNAHCHIELSHMRNAIPEGNGLMTFVQGIMKKRHEYSAGDIQRGIASAFDEMYAAGIVAIGDISNGKDTVAAKKIAPFHIHTFVETLGIMPERATASLALAKNVWQAFKESTEVSTTYIRTQSITPHAPYSVSEAYFQLLNVHNPDTIWSIHNEETPGENQFFKDKTGNLWTLYDFLNIDPIFFTPSGTTSLQTYLPNISTTHPLILVHNTFITAEDLALINSRTQKVTLCLCPNANWYIERQLPPIERIINSGIPICLGTDSLASNHQLSIGSEIQTLLKHHPHLSLEMLLSWATFNGARALSMDHIVGSITVGKKPGLLHISNDLQYIKRIY